MVSPSAHVIVAKELCEKACEGSAKHRLIGVKTHFFHCCHIGFETIEPGIQKYLAVDNQQQLLEKEKQDWKWWNKLHHTRNPSKII